MLVSTVTTTSKADTRPPWHSSPEICSSGRCGCRVRLAPRAPIGQVGLQDPIVWPTGEAGEPVRQRRAAPMVIGCRCEPRHTRPTRNATGASSTERRPGRPRGPPGWHAGNPAPHPKAPEVVASNRGRSSNPHRKSHRGGECPWQRPLSGLKNSRSAGRPEGVAPPAPRGLPRAATPWANRQNCSVAQALLAMDQDAAPCQRLSLPDGQFQQAAARQTWAFSSAIHTPASPGRSLPCSR